MSATIWMKITPLRNEVLQRSLNTNRPTTPKTIFQRMQNYAFKGVTFAVVTFTAITATSFLLHLSQDPSNGRNYAPPTWPPPKDQRPQNRKSFKRTPEKPLEQSDEL